MINRLNPSTNQNTSPKAYSSPHSSPSFEGLKENLRTGEKVYREFKKEFPLLRSNTFVQSKIAQHRFSRKFKTLIPKLQQLSYSYGSGVEYSRSQIKESYPGLGVYIKDLKNVLARTKYANCGDGSHIMQFELLKKGEKPHLISMTVKDLIFGHPVKNGDHEFAVFGLKKGAKLDNPKTWGNEAVVVDPWSNIVMQARDAIEEIKAKLGFEPIIHKIDYEVKDLVKVE